MAKLVLVLGGARSGKSTFAEQQAAIYSPPGNVVYAATAQIYDDEMGARVRAHRSQRPQSWTTVEAPVGVAAALQAAALQPDVVLLDCLTLLTSNLMLGPQHDPDNLPPIEVVEERVNDELTALLDWYAFHSASLIIVSNEVGLGLVPPYPSGRLYRDVLGRANQRLAAVADHVYFLVAGLPVDWKALSRNFGAAPF